MEQDIRKLFKKEEQLKSLPIGHKDDFIEKLNASKQVSLNKTNYRFIYRIAAILVIGLSIVFGVVNINYTTEESIEENILIQQIETIEQEYLANIDKEWKSFLGLAKDQNLIKRYEKRLNELDEDYQEVSKQFKANINNITIIEDLIENLQTRLQLLKDIQEHINILNQEKNEHHENAI